MTTTYTTMEDDAILRSGYDFSRRVLVTKDGTAESLSGATIKASLKNANKSVELIADTAQSSSAEGADWANGIVTVIFSSSLTSALTVTNQATGQNKAWLELSIVKSGARVPCNDLPVIIEKGWTVS